MFKTLLIGAPGGWELLLIVFVLLLLFGSTRLPQLAKGMGKSIKEFKRGLNEGEEEDRAEEARRAQLRTGEAERVRDEDLASDRYANKPR
jgi:sec-independent protein translocase protein TatA